MNPLPKPILEVATLDVKPGQEEAWKKLLHPYYDPFPVVEHYEGID